MMKKAIPVVILLLLLAVSLFSGCVGRTIDTMGWNHKNQEGTAVTIWGQLALTENSENWNEGFVWDTEDHADWKDYAHMEYADNFSGFGFFSLDISNLSRTTQYHYRAFGEYLKGQSQFRVGVDGTFIPGGPRVSSLNTTNVGLTQATFNGNLDHMGGASVCTVNFLYGTDPNVLDRVTPQQNITATGPFSAIVTDLTVNTTCYYKAVAKNDADEWAGFILGVTPGRPYAVTRLPGAVGSDHANLKGELYAMNGTAQCTVWFTYGDTSPNVLDHSSASQVMNALGPFEIPIGNLTPGTKYWYRTIADNGVAQGKGAIFEFTTTTTGITLTEGTLGKPYTPSSGVHEKPLLSRIPPRYLHLLERNPVIARLLHLP